MAWKDNFQIKKLMIYFVSFKFFVFISRSTFIMPKDGMTSFIIFKDEESTSISLSKRTGA